MINLAILSSHFCSFVPTVPTKHPKMLIRLLKRSKISKFCKAACTLGSPKHDTSNFDYTVGY